VKNLTLIFRVLGLGLGLGAQVLVNITAAQLSEINVRLLMAVGSSEGRAFAMTSSADRPS